MVEQEQNNDIVMIEQDQCSPQDKSSKKVEKRTSPSNEEVEDDGNSFNKSKIEITPPTNLQTSVSHEEFVDLRKKDPMAKLRLVMDHKGSSSTPAQDTSIFVRTEPSIKKYEQSLQEFRSKILNMDLIQLLRQDVGAYFEMNL